MKKIILFSLLILPFCHSYPCSCNPQSFEKAVKWADEIFVGRLIQIKEVYSISDEPYTNRIYTGAIYAEFEIEKKWKGDTNRYIKIYQKNGSCGFEFENIGGSYLVYAKNEDVFGFKIKVPTTWLCSRTYSDPEYAKYSDRFYDDTPKLNKSFPNLIKTSKVYINWLSILKWFSILSVGFFFGYKIKKRTNTSNQQVQ